MPRRSVRDANVAVAILRPLSRLSEFLGLDRLENVANRTLGRTSPATPGGVAAPAPGVLPTGTTTAAGHLPRHHPGPTTPQSTPQPTSGKPTGGQPSSAALAQPSAAYPLTILSIGTPSARISATALPISSVPTRRSISSRRRRATRASANLAYYDWAANLSGELRQYHPAVVVAGFGGNHRQPFLAGGRAATPGTAFWRAQYSARVAVVVAEARAAGVVLPGSVCRSWDPPPASPTMAPTLNSVYQQVTASYPGSTYVSLYQLFEDATGGYSEFLHNGRALVEVRDP